MGSRVHKVVIGMGLLVAVVAAALVAIVVAPAPPVGAQTVPPRVLVYGDSLSWEAQAGIEQAIETELPGWDAITKTAAGTATCNGLPQMRADDYLNARVVVLEYVAVSLGPCMAGRDRLAQHTADTEAALALWAARGVRVVLVGAPRMVGEPSDTIDAGAINRDLAAATGQTFVDAGVLLRDPWTGIYQQRLPCLAGEGAAQGCGVDGLIDVRDESGSHFCAIHNVGPCPVYSSGIVRFAAPIADAVAHAAGSVGVAPLPGPPAAGDVQNTVRGLLGSSVDPASIPRRAGASPADRDIADQARLSEDAVRPDFAEIEPASDAAPPAPGLQDQTCRAMRRALRPLGRGARAEASFTAPGTGATIDQVVHVAVSERDAHQAYAAYAAPGATTCLERVLGVPVTAEPTAGIGDASIRFQVDATRDFVLEFAIAGRTVTALAFANAATPPSSDAVTAITKAAVSRADAALLARPAR